MLDHWHSFSPVPAYYTFPLSLSPHRFMGLGKLMAGRIYQIRAQKSYLAADPAWFDLSLSKRCPLCGDEQETFGHAILSCPAKAPAQLRHLQGIASVAPDSPLWFSPLPAPQPGLLHQGHKHQLTPRHALRTTSLPRLNGLLFLSRGPPSDGALPIPTLSPRLRFSHVENRQLFLTLADWLLSFCCCCPFLC